jgi:hypothetical protein
MSIKVDKEDLVNYLFDGKEKDENKNPKDKSGAASYINHIGYLIHKNEKLDNSKVDFTKLKVVK